MDAPPVRNIHGILASLTDLWSPRTVAVVNDYDVRVVKVQGEFTRHSHPETDEFFLVLEGRFDVSLRDPEGRESTVSLRRGDTFVVPRGTEHKPSSAGGAILMFEPSGTLSTGDRHDGHIPGHVDSTIGRAL